MNEPKLYAVYVSKDDEASFQIFCRDNIKWRTVHSTTINPQMKARKYIIEYTDAEDAFLLNLRYGKSRVINGELLDMLKRNYFSKIVCTRD
jgi:hypothetical protein